MNNALIKSDKKMNIIVAVISSVLIVPAFSNASESIDGIDSHAYVKANKVTTTRKWSIEGISVTGPNDVCGEAQWTMPAPFPPNSHFTVLGKFDENPNANNSISLTKDDCIASDTLLATYSNPGLNALGGFPDADSRIKNIPLRQVAVKSFPDGTRMTLPKMENTIGNPFPPTRLLRSKNIVSKDWFSAQGKMDIICYSDGSATVKASFKNLIANAVYGVYSTWLTVPPGQTTPTFVPLAFGGVPNLVSPDSHGRAHFERTFSYCPMDKAPDGSVIMFVNLGFHADNTPSGVFPQNMTEPNKVMSIHGVVFPTSTPPGTVTIPHVQFPISVK